MPRIRADTQPLQRGSSTQALFEPGGVDAVAGAIDIAAKHALVRLHQIRLRARDFARDRALKAPIAPQVAGIEGVADVRLDQLQPGFRPFPRVQRDGDIALQQRFQRAFEKTLGTAVRRIALSDER